MREAAHELAAEGGEAHRQQQAAGDGEHEHQQEQALHGVVHLLLCLGQTTGEHLLSVPRGRGWQPVVVPPLAMLQGTNRLKLAVAAGTVRLKTIRFP